MTKFLRDARSWHGSQFVIEETIRVYVGLRLGLRKRRNCGVDCCCHRNSSFLASFCSRDCCCVAMPGSIEARLGGREKFGVEESVTFRSNLCASDEKEGVS